MTLTSGIEAYVVDGHVPQEVARPRSVAELSTVMADACKRHRAMVPWGGGTRMAVGNLPEKYDLALDLTGLTQVFQHEPGDLTLVVDAGVRVAGIQSRLALQGQRLPFDVEAPEKATIGGSVASNAPGVLRSSYGGIRDWVIGMKVARPDGVVTKSGGRVVKNVQGYDLHRLHTGAFGTLGVITEVAFKLVPLPEHSRTVLAGFPTIAGLTAAAREIFGGHIAPEAWSVFTGPGAVRVLSALPSSAAGQPEKFALLAKVSGGQKAVERQVSDLTEFARSSGAAGVDSSASGQERLWADAGMSGLEAVAAVRLSAKPMDIFRLLEDVSAVEARWPRLRAWSRADCGFGALTVNWWSPDEAGAKDAVTALGKAAELRGASRVIELCPLSMKRGLDVFGNPGPAVGVMRRLKEQYDPLRLLNPGRFAGGI